MATEASTLPAQSSRGVSNNTARLLNLARKDLATKYAGDVANLTTPVIKAIDVADNDTYVALTTVAARKVTVFNDTGGVVYACYTADATKAVGTPNGAIVAFPVTANANELKLKRTGAAPNTKTIGFLVENFA